MWSIEVSGRRPSTLFVDHVQVDSKVRQEGKHIASVSILPGYLAELSNFVADVDAGVCINFEFGKKIDDGKSDGTERIDVNRIYFCIYQEFSFSETNFKKKTKGRNFSIEINRNISW